MKNNWIGPFSLRFYVAFFLISLFGNFFIIFNQLLLETLFCLFIYVSTFVLGSAWGSSLPLIKFANIHLSPNKLANFLLVISIGAVVLSWYYMVQYYGNIDNIFLHAFDVRNETIGDGIQIVPVYITYLGSLVYAAFAITVVLFHNEKSKRYVYKAILLGLLIVLTDLRAFGRIGMLFAIFMIAGYVVLYVRKLNYKKSFIFAIVLYFLLMLPRWFRGGRSLDGIGDRYSKYTTIVIPELLTPILSIYAYYFSGIYAFNELLKKNIDVYAFGQRNFAAIFNFVNRFLSNGSPSHRYLIIGEEVYVPFDTNIYTIVGEIYLDFGLWGIMIIPFIFGSFLGFFFKYNGVYADALKIYLLAWLFYTPIYNVFSFGGFFISNIILTTLVLLSSSSSGLSKT